MIQLSRSTEIDELSDIVLDSTKRSYNPYCIQQ